MTDMNNERTATAGRTAAGRALLLRDQALATLDAGDPAAALPVINQALAVLETAGLSSGPDMAAVLVTRAEIEETADRFGDAAATASLAIRLLDGSTAGDEDDDCLLLWCQAQERLAGLERLGGQFEAASGRLTAVLDRASAELGEPSPAVVSAANALGVVYKYAADFDAAQTAYQRALAAAQAQAALAGKPEPDPIVLAGLLHNLGGLAHARGDFTAGIPLAEEGVALRARAAGAGHPDAARDWNALGTLYHGAGRLRDAAEAYRRALAVFEHRFGPDHFEVGMTCANLAVLASDEGRCEEAESLGRRSARILEAVLGPEDAEVGLTLLNLAACIAQQGRQAEAAALASRSAAILAARLPAGHPYVAAAAEAVRAWEPPA
jgi:tetratricopeptide (TPR) repeat protein